MHDETKCQTLHVAVRCEYVLQSQFVTALLEQVSTFHYILLF